MMSTTRTPINRPSRSRITPRAVEIFKAMEECPGSDRYWGLQGELAPELGLEPWKWPPVVNPDEGESVYPASSAGGRWHAESKALWRAP